MDEGQIIEEATPDKLLTSENERTKLFLSKVLHM